MGRYGNARHPAEDQTAPPPKGRGVGANTALQPVLVSGPSGQAIQLAATMAIAVNTASPMSSGMRVWAGDAGYGVNRMAGKVDPHYVKGVEPPGVGGMVSGAISPVGSPTAVRVGMQSGPSQPAAYPSTGTGSDFGQPLAWMSMGQVGPGLGH
jgi:hypothetical protein